jgi:hypothetical protein
MAKDGRFGGRSSFRWPHREAGKGAAAAAAPAPHEPPRARAAELTSQRDQTIVLVERLQLAAARSRTQPAGGTPLAGARRQSWTADSPTGLGPPLSDLAALTWQTMSGSIAPLSPRRLDFDGHFSS